MKKSRLFLFAVLIPLIFGIPSHAAETRNEAIVQCVVSDRPSGITYLSWDTEGGDKSNRNLLRPDSAVVLQVRSGEQWNTISEGALKTVSDAEHVLDYPLSPKDKLEWTIRIAQGTIDFQFSLQGEVPDAINGFRLFFPLDPTVTSTTVIPNDFDTQGKFQLPLVVTAPDFGQMHLVEKSGRKIDGSLLGSRVEKYVNLMIELPLNEANKEVSFSLTPVYLDPPAGFKDLEFWKKARRGWFGPMQTSCQWGDLTNPYSAPPGLFSNNVISDPASCSVWFYADQVFWTPRLTEDVSAMNIVRNTVDFWLDEKVMPDGEMICYWSYAGFLDANAGPIIAAWDYFTATGDAKWLESKIERLESVADFLIRRDIDGDGMVEAKQSGNYGTLHQPNRSCAWFDAVNCGHKDGYTNAIIFRAWCCMADLEKKLGRHEQAERYIKHAKMLKASYADALRNPETGWLAWWKSEDGTLHDYAMPIVNGLAIEYGLVSKEEGKAILQRFEQKMKDVGFTRYDLGIPCTLVPVLRQDYLLPDASGCPQREDGSDTFGQYQNGGISAGHAMHFITAHYIVGMTERGDFLLNEMMKRQAEGKFQNGVTNEFGRGIDWTDWNGNPSGYEGTLSESCRFLQAALLRDPELRKKYHAPILALDETDGDAKK